MMVGSKSDKKRQCPPSTQIIELVDNQGIAYLECSSLNGDGIKECREKLFKLLEEFQKSITDQENVRTQAEIQVIS